LGAFCQFCHSFSVTEGNGRARLQPSRLGLGRLRWSVALPSRLAHYIFGSFSIDNFSLYANLARVRELNAEADGDGGATSAARRESRWHRDVLCCLMFKSVCRICVNPCPQWPWRRRMRQSAGNSGFGCAGLGGRFEPSCGSGLRGSAALPFGWVGVLSLLAEVGCAAAQPYHSVGLGILSLLAANYVKCLSMNHLRSRVSFQDQSRSRLIKANQVIFLSRWEHKSMMTFCNFRIGIAKR